MAPLLITLTTDFGTTDPYVGIMKGVILGINPDAHIVDISHHVQPQSVLQGAYVIGSSHRYFPQGTIHVVVVDPGVGTSRNALVLVTPTARFLAPDNGVLSYVVAEALGDGHQDPFADQVSVPDGYEAYRLTAQGYWLQPVSATFHGRDVFAPVAAHLSTGVPPERMGDRVSSIMWEAPPRPRWEGDELVGQIVHLDRFGNLITNIPAELLPVQGSVVCLIKDRRIEGLSPSYAEGERLLAVVGSWGTVEVSVKNSSAAEELRAKVGDPVRVSPTR